MLKEVKFGSFKQALSIPNARPAQPIHQIMMSENSNGLELTELCKDNKVDNPSHVNILFADFQKMSWGSPHRSKTAYTSRCALRNNCRAIHQRRDSARDTEGVPFNN